MTQHTILLVGKRHHSQKSVWRSYFVCRAAIPISRRICDDGLL